MRESRATRTNPSFAQTMLPAPKDQPQAAGASTTSPGEPAEPLDVGDVSPRSLEEPAVLVIVSPAQPAVDEASVKTLEIGEFLARLCKTLHASLGKLQRMKSFNAIVIAALRQREDRRKQEMDDTFAKQLSPLAG